ncbi:outer membrane beta-barrel family protein [Mucilaginibacter sp. L196]|uniref:outer membrane beta-barrel family protein n=1 Tax=Mucilaginibacter sp. L196 TaxID=1641870 RepID=UPI00131AB165|nr:outer membrane beta-barrel family protein [Mucilaginibacter sp. L196]
MKTHLLKILTIILCAGYLNTASAQSTNPGKIKGVLNDTQSKPVDYASVSLLNAKDSTTVIGTLSTEAGEYHFDNIKNGTYIVKATVVGYENASSQPFTVSDSSKTILVPVLKMKTSNRNLNTVVITATKPTIEHLADKTVINVAGSVLATGNTAMDILERAPGVTVDKDDNISLKGKQGVTVMINDKLTYLSAAQLATLLRSTDGGTIQSIELITNPSAKYDAAGNSGIINIKLKKNKMSGTNGTVSVTGGLGTYAKSSEEFSINHKEGNLNVFGNFSRGDIPSARIIDIDRVVTDAGQSTYFKQSTFMPQVNHYNNYSFGADYDSSPKNTFGFAVNGYFNQDDQGNTNNTKISSTPTGAPDSTQKTLSQINQSYRNYTIDLNDTYKIDTLGQELSFDVDYSKFNNNSNANYDTFFSNPLNPTEIPLYLRQITPSTINIRVAKVDYTKNMTKSLKLEVGGKYSDVKTDNDLNATTKTDSGYVNDAALTNRFIYDEKISAGYVNFTKTYKNTSVEVGLRGEYTQSKGDLVTQDSINQRKYFNLFPSAFLHHTFNDKNEVNLSYSRRIDRPDYSDLNPFVYYLDQYTYSQGNPFLRPQYTNNFELNYTYNKSYNLSLSYSHTMDAIQQIILTKDATKASYQTNLNISSQDAYNASISIPVTVTKWWSINFDATAFYLKFKSDTLAGGTLNRGKLAYVVKANQTFTFAGFKAELFANYQSPLTYGLYDIYARYNVDAGISHSFDNKKLNIKFSVSDIFNTQRNNLDINYQSDNLQIRQKNESRIARLSLTYNFGNSSIKKREHQNAMGEEGSRAGGQ